jgi:hypothetical protein
MPGDYFLHGKNLKRLLKNEILRKENFFLLFVLLAGFLKIVDGHMTLMI